MSNLANDMNYITINIRVISAIRSSNQKVDCELRE